jgi:hypothetical protein
MLSGFLACQEQSPNQDLHKSTVSINSARQCHNPEPKKTSYLPFPFSVQRRQKVCNCAREMS